MCIEHTELGIYK